ncbi:MAG: lactonase family protein [Caldilineaceae bacterium]|nr:lactonase family protein [Caldilineaceae bacterium]
MTDGAMYLYVGTYTRSLPHVQAKSEGIYLLKLDPTTGALSHVNKITGVDNPSYLTLHPNGKYLYAVNEVGDFGGKDSGAVSAFAIDATTGQLTFLNQETTDGSAPCHLCVDQTGRYLLTANYSGGSVCVHPIGSDGRLAPLHDFVQHTGSSINPQRQQEPHAHSFTIAADNRFAYAADLGMDRVLIYAFNADQGKLTPAAQPWVRVHPGAGPRHFDFHPDGHYAYVINELDSTVTAFAYEASNGRLTEIQSLSTLPAGFDGRSHCADIHVHPAGKFVYGSNRGHDSIAIFAIDTVTGHLTAVGHESTQGAIPRNFVIDPTGTFLLAANQNTDTVVSFWIDQATGQLTPTGHRLDVPTPVCLKFWR